MKLEDIKTFDELHQYILDAYNGLLRVSVTLASYSSSFYNKSMTVCLKDKFGNSYSRIKFASNTNIKTVDTLKLDETLYNTALEDFKNYIKFGSTNYECNFINIDDAYKIASTFDYFEKQIY